MFTIKPYNLKKVKKPKLNTDNMQKITGKEIADYIYEEIDTLNKNREKTGTPTLEIYLVGDDPASAIYVKKKKEACEKFGFNCIIKRIENEEGWYSTLTTSLLQSYYNKDVHGTLVQLPLPKREYEKFIPEYINPLKDIDGFTDVNMGKIVNEDIQCFIPPTVNAVLNIINHHYIKTEGKRILILGRSNIVGKPLSIILSNSEYNGIVTLLHSKFEGDIKEYVNNSDIIISATGNPNIFPSDTDFTGKVVIDVGTNKVDGKLVGDIPEELKEKADKYTPVPGGVGPLTVACLIQNLYDAFLEL